MNYPFCILTPSFFLGYSKNVSQSSYYINMRRSIITSKLIDLAMYTKKSISL